MIFSKHRRKLDAKRRFGTKDFQSKVKQAQTYKRSSPVGSLNRKNRWVVLMGFRSKFFRIAWGIGLVTLAYFFIFSDFLKVDSLELVGNEKVTTEQVQTVLSNLGTRRTALVPKSNFFLLTRGRFNESLTQAVPLIKEVKSYKRVWPNKIVVEIDERNPGFVLRSNEQDYLVDDEGMVVKLNPDTQNLPLVNDTVVENFDVGLPLPNTKMVAFILSIHKQWPGKISTALAETKIPGKASNEVQIVTQEGWGVFFDTNRSVSSQLGNLSLILSNQVPTKDRPNLAYIDLRLSKWAYFCYKNTPCVAGAQEPQPTVEPDLENLTPPSAKPNETKKP
jgi:cell division septal protein FtsQ